MAANIFFAASQFAGDMDRAMERDRASDPLKIRWSTLFSAPIASATNSWTYLASRSGLLHVNTGVESINQHTLATMHKSFNQALDYSRMIKI